MSEIEYTEFTLSPATLTVYDILGKKVETYASGVESAGIRKVTFNESRFANGVDFYKIRLKPFSGTHIAYTKTMNLKELDDGPLWIGD